MRPAQQRQVLQQRVIDMPVAAQRMRRPLHVDRGPQYDSRCNRVEAAEPVALLLKAAVADLSHAVEEHGARPARGAPGPCSTRHERGAAVPRFPDCMTTQHEIARFLVPIVITLLTL